MQHVKSQQRLLSDLMAAEQEELNRRPDEGRLLRDTGPDCDCPERELIPRQQVAGERQEQRREKRTTPTTQLIARGPRYAPVKNTRAMWI